jgi:preprotein translocase subunit SecA
MVTRAIENAQKKVEGRNFDQRKNLLEYDDVMNQQRKSIYNLRRQILEGRYAPTLSAEEIKAGKQPEVPTESGTWTVESLSGDIRGELEALIEQVSSQHEERSKAIAAGEAAGELPPLWRVLRHEIWRTTGALCDLEKRVNGPRVELVDHVVEHVASSLIQQRERLYDLSEAMIAQTIERFCPPHTHEDQWDLDALKEALREQFNMPVELEPGQTGSAEELAAAVWEQVERRVEARIEELSRPWLMYFVRHFFLEEIDQQWVDHLKTMDHLREGIYLRGYGQKDPKKEYKKEGFELFGSMMERIQTNVCTKIFRVQIRREEEIPELRAKQRRMTAVHPSATDASAGSAGAGAENGAESAGSSTYGDAADGGKQEKQQTVRRTEPKVGRNDPCPCGSGKKYKKCHGAAGAEASL